MNRRVWGVVGLVVAVLGAGSALAGSAGQAGPALAAARHAVAWVGRTSQGIGWPALVGAALAAIGLVMATGQRRRSGHAEPWRTVIHMGRQGRSASVIAQATGLAQDAVRIALSPVLVESVPRGNSFRPSPPDRGNGRVDNPPPPDR